MLESTKEYTKYANFYSMLVIARFNAILMFEHTYVYDMNVILLD